MKTIRAHALLLMMVLVPYSASSTNFFKQVNKDLRHLRCDLKELKNCVCKCTLLTQDDFKDSQGNLRQTVEITKPGNYCLAEDIPFAPTEIKTSAIRIASSDVILDLCGYTLSQSNDTYQTIGIVVENKTAKLQPVGNVTIKGSYGVIRNFSQLGLQVKGGTNNITIGDSTKLTISFNGGKTPRAYKNPDTNECFYEGGAQFGETTYLADLDMPQVNGAIDTLTIENVLFDSNVVGAWLGNAQNVSATTSSFSNNFEERISDVPLFPLSVDTVYCFGLVTLNNEEDTGVQSLSLSSCQFNENSTLVDGNPSVIETAHGCFIFTKHSGLQAKNCQFNGNHSGRKDGVSGMISQTLVSGCTLGGGVCSTFDCCQFNGNESVINVHGFHQRLSLPQEGNQQVGIPGKSLLLKKCQASNNARISTLNHGVTVVSLDMHGICIESVSGFTIRDCVIENNSLTSVESEGFSNLNVFALCLRGEEGFLLTDGEIDSTHIDGTASDQIKSVVGGILISTSDFVQNISIHHCTICDNKGTNMPRGLVIRGIADADAESFITIEHNLISNHASDGGGGVGILVENAGKVSVLKNEIDQCDTGVLLQQAPCITVLGNLVQHNASIGISDTMNPSTSFIALNKAFNNGMNYNVTYPFGPVPVQEECLQKGFPESGGACDNVGITKTCI